MKPQSTSRYIDIDIPLKWCGWVCGRHNYRTEGAEARLSWLRRIVHTDARDTRCGLAIDGGDHANERHACRVGLTGSPLATEATTLISLWQTNSVGLRSERFVNWAFEGPVVYLNADWLAVGSPHEDGSRFVAPLR